MFICNHCPYVKAIIRDLALECNKLKKDGINSVAIMSNDTKNYHEDSIENKIKFAKKMKIPWLESNYVFYKEKIDNHAAPLKWAYNRKENWLRFYPNKK